MSIPLIGHNRQIEYLNTSKQRERMSHSYLFYGPEHVGKLTIALALAKSFFCTTAVKTDIRSTCGQCRDCQHIDQINHPHLIFIDTTHTLVSKKETRKEIPIEDIRELKRVFLLAPEGDTMRLAIINEADKMSAEAASALLKLLEEPGSQTLFILIAAHQDLVLPTLVSRSQSIGFLTVSDTRLREYLNSTVVDGADHDEFLTIASGRPGILIRLCEEESYATQEKLLFKEIDRVMRTRDIIGGFHISEQIASESALRQEAIGWIMMQLRQSLVVQHSSDARRTIHTLKYIDRIASLLDTTNVNPRLALDALFLQIIR